MLFAVLAFVPRVLGLDRPIRELARSTPLRAVYCEPISHALRHSGRRPRRGAFVTQPRSRRSVDRPRHPTDTVFGDDPDHIAPTFSPGRPIAATAWGHGCLWDREHAVHRHEQADHG